MKVRSLWVELLNPAICLPCMTLGGDALVISNIFTLISVPTSRPLPPDALIIAVKAFANLTPIVENREPPESLMPLMSGLNLKDPLNHHIIHETVLVRIGARTQHVWEELTFPPVQSPKHVILAMVVYHHLVSLSPGNSGSLGSSQGGISLASPDSVASSCPCSCASYPSIVSYSWSPYAFCSFLSSLNLSTSLSRNAIFSSLPCTWLRFSSARVAREVISFLFFWALSNLSLISLNPYLFDAVPHQIQSFHLAHSTTLLSPSRLPSHDLYTSCFF